MTYSNRFLTPSQPLNAPLLSAWVLLQVRICACRSCPRLVAWREAIPIHNSDKQKKRNSRPEYWSKPVPGFGDPFARLMVVGLSPSAFGSNRTGRLFTGDTSGNFLFAALHRAGFSTQPYSLAFGDDTLLQDVYVTSVGRCAAPKNRPMLSELDACQGHLAAEIELLGQLQGMIVLGRVAFERILTIFRSRRAELPPHEFKHGAFFELGPALPWVLCSYHPSQQNTQTGRLNETMFDQIWNQARDLLQKE